MSSTVLQKIVNHPDLLISYFKRLGITGKQKNSNPTVVVDLENDSQESIIIDDEIFDLNEELSDSKSEVAPKKKIVIPVKNIDSSWANPIFDESIILIYIYSQSRI